jgi:flagellar basal body-associated protein FliL
MTKNQKIIIIIVVLLVLLAALAALVFRAPQPAAPSASGQPSAAATSGPQFMSQADQAQFGIATSAPVQIFRDASGQNVVYKIIRQDSDVVADPAALGPVSPRQKLPAAR